MSALLACADASWLEFVLDGSWAILSDGVIGSNILYNVCSEPKPSSWAAISFHLQLQSTLTRKIDDIHSLQWAFRRGEGDNKMWDEKNEKQIGLKSALLKVFIGATSGFSWLWSQFMFMYDTFMVDNNRWHMFFSAAASTSGSIQQSWPCFHFIQKHGLLTIKKVISPKFKVLFQSLKIWPPKRCKHICPLCRMY